MMSRAAAFVGLFALLALWDVSSSGAARAAEGFPVQMRSFTAPTVDADGKTAGSTPVTVIFEVVSERVAGQVCRNSVRVQDALMQHFYAEPLVRDGGGTLVVDGRGEGVAEAINKVLTEPLILRAFVIDGAVSMGGGVVARLPFSSVHGCRTGAGR